MKGRRLTPAHRDALPDFAVWLTILLICLVVAAVTS